jgi:hypothetical protein
MEFANDKQRIAVLEQALEDCIAMLQSLPANPAVWGMARKAQVVLDTTPANQPLFGTEVFTPLGEDPSTSSMKLRVVVGPTAQYVNLSVEGNVQRNANTLLFSLNGGGNGLLVPIAPSPGSAAAYRGSIAKWDGRRMLNLGGTMRIER